MCGVFGVLGGLSYRTPPTAQQIRELLQQATAALDGESNIGVGLERAAESLSLLNELLKGGPGVEGLFRESWIIEHLHHALRRIDSNVLAIEKKMDEGEYESMYDIELLNRSIVLLKDGIWAIDRDRLRTAREVGRLATGQAEPSADELVELPRATIEIFLSIQLALSAIDRLEVRGRDSAGIAILIDGHGISTEHANALLGGRSDPLLSSGSARVVKQTAVFVYKAAAEIGALGDNIKVIRRAIMSDEGLRQFTREQNARATIISHTRWASCGTISEANAHPVDSCEVNGAIEPYIVAALNGDIDNYAQLREEEHLAIADEITSDTKVIPTMTARRVRNGASLLDAFRSAAECFVGSFAIAAASASEPSRILLAVHGSGQGCYIGLAEEAFVVASEPYGLAEVCSTYVRVDGETPSESSGRTGQVVVLSREKAGTLEGMSRWSFGGETLPFSQRDVISLEVTTRDIDRGDATHFLFKEISEAPKSMQRTIRGKIIERTGRLGVSLSDNAFPKSIRNDLRSGAVKNIIAIGQGTAYVASKSLTSILERLVPSGVSVSVRPATEVSGFYLRDDMSDTLIVAVSQSGTTTDTNRTVDMIRARGGRVIAIVNRRQSDLTEKADGVLYTSDGRDVEMSVASTKAFYAQVTACTLLGIAIAEALGAPDRQECQAILQALRQLPNAMGSVLARRAEIGEIARTFAPHRKSWAIVGSGPNHIAASEVRIKLSELCYKSIACDFTEDKKHIDLSAEPLILVCAAGLGDSNASDVGKEIAIYKAHKAVPIVIASEGVKFDAAAAIVHVPYLHPAVDFILSTMVGHLFGYEAALAINGQGNLMRSARAVVEDALADEDASDDELLAVVRESIQPVARMILVELTAGALNGHLDAAPAVKIASLLRYALGQLPLESLEFETGEPTSPRMMLRALVQALSKGVDELTRPIDAVKHQAKTVTVGISRTEQELGESRLIDSVLNAGAKRKSLGYRTMRMLAALDVAVHDIVGFTRYEVDGDIDRGDATLHVVCRGGIAENIASRTDTDPRLTGTKHRAAYERMVTVGRGLRDNRSVIIVPETHEGRVIAITLLHVEFDAFLGVEDAVAMLKGYRNRYSAIADVVTETQPSFDESKFASIAVVDLLVEPVRTLAQHW